MGFISGPLAEHSIIAHARNERGVAALITKGKTAGMPQSAAVADLVRGLHWTLAYVIGFSALGTLIMAGLLLRYYRSPQVPDITAYVKQGEPAFDSPSLA